MESAALILLLALPVFGQTTPEDLGDVRQQEDFEHVLQEVRKTNRSIAKTNRANTWTEPQVFEDSVTFAYPLTQSIVLVSTHIQIFVSTISGLTNSGVFVSSKTTFDSFVNVSSNVNVTGGVFMSYGVPGVVRACSAAQVMTGITVSSGIVTAGTCGPPPAVLTYYSSVTVQAMLGLVLQASDEYSLIVSSGPSTMLQVTKYGVVHSTTQPGARFFRTSAMSAGASANVTLTFPSRDYNVQNIFAVATATVPAGGEGKYSLHCFASFASNSGGRRAVWAAVNGSIPTGCKQVQLPVSGDETQVNAVCAPYLVAGDAVTCNVFQDSGGPLNVNGAAIEVLKLL